MEQALGKNGPNMKVPLRNINNAIIKPNKCSQCDFRSSRADNLRTHLKIHSGEKSNKCNQCNYASSRVDSLRTHLKTHSGEKPNKCNQCEYASSQAGNLRKHLKTHNREKPKKCNQGDNASSMKAIWGDIWKRIWHSVKKRKKNATNEALLLLMSLLGDIWKKTQMKLYSFLAHTLKMHFKTHKKCDSAFSLAGNLRGPKSDQTSR